MDRESIVSWAANSLPSWLIGVISAAGAIIAGWSAVFQILIVVMVADILTGLSAAIIARSVNSDSGWRGMFRKAVTLIAVGLAYFVGERVNVPAGEAVAGFYIAVEAISVFENMARAGVPVPDALRNLFSKISGEKP